MKSPTSGELMSVYNDMKLIPTSREFYRNSMASQEEKSIQSQSNDKANSFLHEKSGSPFVSPPFKTFDLYLVVNGKKTTSMHQNYKESIS